MKGPHFSSGSKLTVDGVPPLAHPHRQGFGREIPLLNVERLRPKIRQESGIDPHETNAVIRRERSRRSCLIEGSISAPGRKQMFENVEP